MGPISVKLKFRMFKIHLDGVFKARTSFNRPGVYLDLTIQDGIADLTIKPSYIKLNFASREYVEACTRLVIYISIMFG